MKNLLFVFLFAALSVQSQKALKQSEYQYRYKGQPGDTISNNDTLWNYSIYPNKSYFTSCNIRVDIDSISGSPSMNVILQAKIYKNNSYANISSVTWYGTSSDTVIEFNRTEFINKYRYFNVLFDANTTNQLSSVNNIYFLFRDRAESFDVWIQDQTTNAFRYALMREDKTDITLTESIQVDSFFCLVSSGHGFTGTGEYIVIQQGGFFTQLEVRSASNDTIYTYADFTASFSTAAVVIRGSIDMNVDADTTTQNFIFNLRNGTTAIDIQNVLVIMEHSTAGDKSKFGDLAALTNGLRFKKLNTSQFGLGNYKSTSDFDQFGGDVTFDDKAGGGNHSTTIKYNIKEKYGIVFRFDPRLNDTFKATARDDLSGLVLFRIILFGQYTLGE